MLTLHGQATGLPTVIDVPAAESPAQHVRNALMLLALLKDLSPAVWQLHPELGRAQRRAEAAVMLLEHHGPPLCAARHVQRALEALLHAKVDWEVIDIIPAAMGRLFTAWFPLPASVEEN